MLAAIISYSSHKSDKLKKLIAFCLCESTQEQWKPSLNKEKNENKVLQTEMPRYGRTSPEIVPSAYPCKLGLFI
jgi:hypothetical protein